MRVIQWQKRRTGLSEILYNLSVDILNKRFSHSVTPSTRECDNEILCFCTFFYWHKTTTRSCSTCSSIETNCAISMLVNRVVLMLALQWHCTSAELCLFFDVYFSRMATIDIVKRCIESLSKVVSRDWIRLYFADKWLISWKNKLNNRSSTIASLVDWTKLFLHLTCTCIYTQRTISLDQKIPAWIRLVWMIISDIASKTNCIVSESVAHVICVYSSLWWPLIFCRWSLFSNCSWM